MNDRPPMTEAPAPSGSKPTRWRRRFFSAVIACVAVSAAYVGLSQTAVFQTIEGATLNWRFQLRGAVAPSGKVVVLAIDDRTLAAHGPWPIPRDVLAKTVQKLKAAGATAIAFDLLFVDPPRPRSNETDGTDRLAAAIRAAGNVIVPFAFLFDPNATGTFTDAQPVARAAYRVYRLPPGQRVALPFQPTGLLAPIGPLLDAGHLAHANAVVDADGGLRFFDPVIAFDDAYFPGLPVEAARLHLGLGRSDVSAIFYDSIRLGPRDVATDGRMRVPVNYYGPTGTIVTRSLTDFLDGRIPDSAVAGRAVLIGATATGVGDRFPSPFSRALPAVEYFATVTDNVISGRPLIRSMHTAVLSLIAIFAGGLLAAGLWYVHRPAYAIAAAAGLVIAWAAVAYWSFATAGLWLNATFPALAIVVNVALVTAGRTVQDNALRRTAEGERAALARFVSPIVTAEFGRSGVSDGAARHQPAAVLFVDLRGFTALSERLGDDAILPLIRDFHRRVERAVTSHRGTLDKFIGDGAMAIFGFPEPSLRDPADALACARHLIDEIERWNGDLNLPDDVPMAVGIGVHYGPIVLAQVGGDQQAQMTASGDTVNVAARLEEMTKDHAAEIIGSEALVGAVRNLARDDLLVGFQRFPDQEIRGRTERMDLWVWRQAGADIGGT